MYDVIIIGAGPAGITSAIYCKRANLNVCIVEKSVIGGNPVNYSEIENYPGFYGTTFDLIEKLRDHLEYFKIPVFEFENIEHIDLQEKLVKTENNTLYAKKIILATGSKPKKLGVPGEDEFFGRGVHYCAICDGPQYKDKIVAVIGGGNSACEEALGLSKICNNVHIIEFTNKLNAEQTTIDKINNTENITVFTSLRVDEILGEDYVTGIKTYPVKGYANFSQLTVDGVFVYIGMSPNLPTIISKPVGFTNDDGYIYVNEDMETSCPDIYAVGDITSKKYRQVITAMNDGAIAAIHISKNI